MPVTKITDGLMALADKAEAGTVADERTFISRMAEQHEDSLETAGFTEEQVTRLYAVEAGCVALAMSRVSISGHPVDVAAARKRLLSEDIELGDSPVSAQG